MLAEHKFDAVVLQEQSHTPVSDPESFFSAVEALHKMIEENGARTYLYATWGYSALHPKLSLYGADTLDMEKRLRNSYMKIAKRLGITVCQVGAAMSYAYLYGVTGLYKEDHYHPDACGSLIAAAVIFEGLFGNEPSIADVGGVSLSCDEIKAVREALAFAREVH